MIMNQFNRRQFLQLAGASGLTLLGGQAAFAKASGHVVVIGGGFGGATAAKYLRKLAPGTQVTLIEPSKSYITCPGSNWVIGGMRKMGDITQSYNGLKKLGVKVVHDSVSVINPEKKELGLKGGKKLSYDRLIVSPGIDFKWDAIEGYNEAASALCPHAWKAGPQTELLIKQLKAMPEDGTFVMAIPADPYRCPPGPYERASMVAHYCKQHKPKAKIVLLDAKANFSKEKLFKAGWSKLYGDMIKWVGQTEDGKVLRVDPKTKTAYTEFGEHKADVLNVIPPQQAGAIARDSDLADDKGWCPVNPRTFESTKHAHIHVIGDSSIAAPMPKSGYSANSQGKVVAAAVAALMAGQEPPEPAWINTCYSLIGPEYGISVAGIYKIEGDKLISVKDSGGVSAPDLDTSLEAAYGQSWYATITDDIFA